MEFLCTYVKTFRRDEKTGYTRFAVKTDDLTLLHNDYGNVFCCGIIPPYPINIPLLITGEIKGKTVYVTSVMEQSGSKAATIDFLSGSEFKGIGPVTAKNIVDKIGEDVFEFCKRKDALSSLLKIKGLQEKDAKRLIRKINKLSSLNVLIQYITSIGGNYYNAIRIYKKYGEESMQKIKYNPYLLRYANVPYYTCEAIAKRNNMNALDERRVRGLVEECMDRNENSGNTRISFHALCELAEKIEKQANMGYVTPPLYIGAELTEKKYVVKEEDNDVFLYKKETYDIEKSASDDIMRLINSKKTLLYKEEILSEIEKECKITYSEKQKKAFRLLKSTGIKIMIGGPGTGKTTTLNGLIRFYEEINPEGKIALCAPTGSAAKRMREATGRFSQTICKLLDVRPFGEYTKCKDEFDQLDYDFIVVDEASMIDSELLAMLLRAVKTGSLVLFVGDSDQLESVKSGNVLYDLVHSNRINTVVLEQCFRQESKTTLSKNIKKLQNKEVELNTDATFVIKRIDDIEALKKDAFGIIDQLYDAKSPGKTKIFSPLRNKKYELGCVKLNENLQGKYNRSEKERGVYYGGVFFLPGDPIVMKKNNYTKNYFNGDTGYIDGILYEEGEYKMIINTEDNTIELSEAEIEDVELAYVTTVHKAQGMECENVVLILPKSVISMLNINILYVAITRAKKRVYIYSEGDAVDIALKNEHHNIRQTGLQWKLHSLAEIAA